MPKSMAEDHKKCDTCLAAQCLTEALKRDRVTKLSTSARVAGPGLAIAIKWRNRGGGCATLSLDHKHWVIKSGRDEDPRRDRLISQRR